jgi:hypothetical protein
MPSLLEVIEIKNHKQQSSQIFDGFDTVTNATVMFCEIPSIIVDLDKEFYVIREEPKGFLNLIIVEVKA